MLASVISSGQIADAELAYGMHWPRINISYAEIHRAMVSGDPSFAWYVGGSELAKILIKKERATSARTGRPIITIIPRRLASSRCIGSATATPTCAVAIGLSPTLAEAPAGCGIGRRAAAVRCIYVDGRGLGALCAATLRRSTRGQRAPCGRVGLSQARAELVRVVVIITAASRTG
ncbi:unnamed protein product [Phytophthora fragariaefolia]|uniref:Unnamed protein product n=1 Tax=Phytophthora fragariaefolia TaxID=1490495 RepID=A0A9W6YBY8_9STRA|nr:unnamed protein product [Phytophthora fragariaefolia]